MNVNDLQHGEIFTIGLRLLDEKPPSLTGGQELVFVFSEYSEELMIRTADSRDLVEVEGRTKTDVKHLKKMRELDSPRLSWLLNISHQNNEIYINVSIHYFDSERYIPNELSFGVDERIVSRIEKLTRKRKNTEEACRWLEEKFLLPSTRKRGVSENNTPEPKRMISIESPDERANFRLLGHGFVLDIKTVQDTLIVSAITTFRKKEYRPKETLIEVAACFEDITKTAKVRHSIKVQLEKIAKSESYLKLWEEYQSIEKNQLRSEAEELGYIRYQAYKFEADGLVRFTVKNADDLKAFEKRIHSEDLQTGEEPPEFFPEQDSGTSSKGKKFVGTVDHCSKNEIFLRQKDENSDIDPPVKGFLFKSMIGDEVRLARREAAISRLRSAAAHIPQLALILEGEAVSTRRFDREKELTTAAKKVFNSEPTPAQRDALYVALNTPDIALIQGPPGTGKTTVIAALMIRLAEIEAEQAHFSGRSLLTSYQHDAVDNATERTLVYGLPPARFGGSSSSKRSDHADRWAADKRDFILSQLNQFDEQRPQKNYKDALYRVAEFTSGKLSSEETLELIDYLINSKNALSTTLIEELHDLKNLNRAEKYSGDLEGKLRLKLVRKIPPQNIAFQDGGPANCRIVLRQLDAILDEKEKALLGKAASMENGIEFAEIGKLEDLRNNLIDRLKGNSNPNIPRPINPKILETFNEVINELHENKIKHPGGQADALDEFVDTLKSKPRESVALLQNYSAVYAATVQQSVSRAINNAIESSTSNSIVFENIVVDEAARANPLDLFIPMVLGKRRIILVGDHRQLPHLLEPSVEREVSENISEELHNALKKSLFERLFENLKARQLEDKITRVVTLKDQFRMHPALGEFVSDVFYEPFGEGFNSPIPKEAFIHALPNYTKDSKPAYAVWKDLGNQRGGETRKGTSWVRKVEADWIAKEVKNLIDSDEGRQLTIGVITFYKAQVGEVLEAMLKHKLSDRDTDSGKIEIADAYKILERDHKRIERLRVGTVDGFQGDGI